MLKKIRNILFYEWTLVFLALINTVLFIYEILGYASASQISLIQTFDLVVALVFLSDFLIGFYLSLEKLKYIKENWLNLLSSIPVTDNIYRSLRILRIFRAVRIIKTANAISNSHRIKKFISKKSTEETKID